ncbi:30S ribosomal protein S6 [Amygdalobacter nucleatus]|uniref:30S ribosomal protein S6 n=1 Tax=Amygdalobacter nucleatus TaxID=3029274 RepID=UPI00279CB8E5|nr:30S ribosomal protein S6 [Amygdalobacter nucleatus]WEG37414.1 30S ribosomal protein S6 [Amygdalobacter nucleatus]
MDRNYELMFALIPTLDEETLQKTVEDIETLVSSNATITSKDAIGKQRLAYEINDHKEAFYYVVKFQTANLEHPKEIDRLLKINEAVLRFIIVREEK